MIFFLLNAILTINFILSNTMHELWVCKAILEIVQQKAATEHCTHIKKVIVEMGQLVAIDKDSLLFSFNVITKGTLAENAKLQIIDIPGQAFCESCQKQVPLQQYYDPCQACGGHQLKVLQGEELQVKSMVMEIE